MTYASRADLETAWSAETVLRLAARAGDETGAAAVAQALAHAAALIDARLGARFALPLPEIPPLLTSVAVDLAIDRLAATADLSTDIIAGRAKLARADLAAIADGSMALGLPTRAIEGGGTAAAGSGGPSPRPIVGPGGGKLFGPGTRGL